MSSEIAGNSKLIEGAIAVLGVVVGAALSYVRDISEWLAKRRSVEIGAAFELRKAQRAIHKKMDWLSRSIPINIKEAVASRVVTVNGHDLYLGEDEEFEVPIKFWERNYRDILSLLSTRRFPQFAEAFDLVQSFEVKFREMKNTFRGSVGEPKVMAEACYQDLRRIMKRLDESDAVKFVNSRLPESSY